MIILNFKYNIILLVKKIIMKEFIDNIKKCINYIIDKIKELKEEFEGRKRYWLMYQDHEWWFNRNPYRTTKKQRRKAEYERSLTNSQKRLRLATTEMGSVLQRTAQSVNIKERLDFSCAIFDAAGQLIANAPHMPVHLGSMGVSVRAIMAEYAGKMRAGDAWLLNSPYAGGTHLPDLTVISPVYLSNRVSGAPDFYVASRAHHADVGGISPGSMPPHSRCIDEEGILFAGFLLVKAHQLQEPALLQQLQSGPWPARNPRQNLADLAAQLAANTRGARELQRAATRYGAARLCQAMREVQDNAEHCVRSVLKHLRSGACEVPMDCGVLIKLRIAIDADAASAIIDFTGSSPQGEHNFNAPRAVCVAAVLYVIRTLVKHDIPLNEGCLRPLELRIPSGSVLDPVAPAAVVAGNVETSQCIVDALYGALGLLAASQGTMNNLTFGNAQLQYYETIAGGAGAGASFAGCDAVQTHMTNSRLTDPEILESRFPVRLRRFAIRPQSGGRGRHRGGHGAWREIEFLAPMQAAILANRRRLAPFGLAGGSAGACGVTQLQRTDGSVLELAGCADFDVVPGDVLSVLTPGGGGFGDCDLASPSARVRAPYEPTT